MPLRLPWPAGSWRGARHIPAREFQIGLGHCSCSSFVGPAAGISFRKSSRRSPPGAVAGERGDRRVLHAGAGQVGDGDVAVAIGRPCRSPAMIWPSSVKSASAAITSRLRWHDAVRRAAASAWRCRRHRDRPCAMIAGAISFLCSASEPIAVMCWPAAAEAGLQDRRFGRRRRGDDDVGAGDRLCRDRARRARRCRALRAVRPPRLRPWPRRAPRCAPRAIGRTSVSASSCSRACTPAPKIAATDGIRPRKMFRRDRAGRRRADVGQIAIVEQQRLDQPGLLPTAAPSCR